MKSDHLFRLIRSLDPAERRYFQLRSGTYKKENGNLAQRLFGSLEKQLDYDEEAAIREVCADRPDRQFHVLKNQLYHQLLDALVHFRKQADLTDRINLLLQKSRVLQEKKLYDEANRFLRRAARLAEKFDQFEQLLIIYKEWKHLYAWILEVDKRAHHINRFWQMEQDALEQLDHLRTLEWLSMQVFDLYYLINYARDEQQKAQYTQLMQHPLLQAEERNLSFSARVVFLNTHGLYEDALGRRDRSIRFRKKLVELYQSRPDRLAKHFSQYLAAYNNYLLGLIHEHRFEEATLALTTFRDLPDNWKQNMRTTERVMWFRAYYSLQLEVYIRQGQFGQAGQLFPKVLAGFEDFGKDLNPAFRFPFHYFFAYTCFALSDYDQALIYLEPLIYQVELQFKQELFRFARLLQLIIHLERADYEYLFSLLRSTRRYLKRLGGTHPLEETILKFLAGVPYADERGAFQELYKDLTGHHAEICSPHILHHFQFLVWIRSHLERRSFVEIFQENMD